MSRRVDDVDVHVAIADGAVFGKNGDAAFAFQVIGIHDALGHAFVRGKGAGLAQQLVDQRGLAVVDVGDDGDIADGARHAKTCEKWKTRKHSTKALPQAVC